jgi:hypothetical protein
MGYRIKMPVINIVTGVFFVGLDANDLTPHQKRGILKET